MGVRPSTVLCPLFCDIVESNRLSVLLRFPVGTDPFSPSCVGGPPEVYFLTRSWLWGRPRLEDGRVVQNWSIPLLL